MSSENRPTAKGRGSQVNPPNRFGQQYAEIDLEFLEHDAESLAALHAPHTEFLPDHSRSIVAENDSPDIPFRYSLNPYRGCEHGCSYCLSGDTPILMGDGTTKPLSEIRAGDLIYGTVRQGWYLRYTRTRVLDHWQTIRSAYRVTLRDGTTLIASADHRFLTERGWKHVAGAGRGADCRPHLTANNKLMGTGAFARSPGKGDDYRQGYLSGIIRGDGLVATYHYARVGCRHGDQHQFRLALIDGEALDRSAAYLQELDITTRRFVFQRAPQPEKVMHAIRTSARHQVERIRRIIAPPDRPTEEWAKGFLAGIFDAEGSYSGGILRIVNTDSALIGQITASLQRFGFHSVVEIKETSRRKALHCVRLCGGLREHLRFFHTVDPAITRKRMLEGQAVKSAAELGILSVETLGLAVPLFDITTGTGNFIANGVVSHNCYARPTHEYLGLNAGLDFETKILVKERAPQLLREWLSRDGYVPETINFSGVTDCYQPAERRYRLTRACLEVALEARQPVTIITKNALVARDLDVLRGMAGWDVVRVAVSVTTLDAELARRMEPRTSAPAARLRAIGALRAAGVPAFVMIGPVIPGLNDSEIPAILKAAADAGAVGAGYNLLRLPGAVRPVFLDWLERAEPTRKERVLSLLRSTRGGQLNENQFGARMRGTGEIAAQIRRTFEVFARKRGLADPWPSLSTAHFRPPKPTAGQLRLF